LIRYSVIPAKAGIYSSQSWIPAFAGMTIKVGLAIVFATGHMLPQKLGFNLADQIYDTLKGA